MNYELEQALNFSGIEEVEKITGKSHHEFNSDEQMLALALHARNSAITKDMLKGINDTHFSMKWEEFKTLLLSKGLEIGLSYKFDNEGTENEAIIFYEKKRGLIVWANSYYDSLNEAKLYAQVKYDDEIEFTTKVNKFWDKTYEEMVMSDKLQLALESLNGFSHDAFINIGKGIEISLDCREGMFYKLESVEKHLSFMKQWNKLPFLWFLDYTETRSNSYDRESINNDKITRSNDDVKFILGINKKLQSK